MHCVVVLIPELGFLQEKTEQIIEVTLPLWEKKRRNLLLKKLFKNLLCESPGCKQTAKHAAFFQTLVEDFWAINYAKAAPLESRKTSKDLNMGIVVRQGNL